MGIQNKGFWVALVGILGAALAALAIGNLAVGGSVTKSWLVLPIATALIGLAVGMAGTEARDKSLAYHQGYRNGYHAADDEAQEEIEKLKANRRTMIRTISQYQRKAGPEPV